jgi:hypothetical protein
MESLPLRLRQKRLSIQYDMQRWQKHRVRRADYRLGRNRDYKHRTVLRPQRGHDGLVCSARGKSA